MESSKKEIAQKHITLCYFNRYLRDRGTITEREYFRLSHLINTKYPFPIKEK